MLPGQTCVAEDPDNTEVPQLDSRTRVPVLRLTPGRPHRWRLEGVLSWSWLTSRAAGSGVCPTGASRSATRRLSSPRLDTLWLLPLLLWTSPPPLARTQVLQAAWDQFCCLDTFTGRLNNIVYVFCHDPTGPQRHSKEFWEVGLHTDVRFR